MSLISKLTHGHKELERMLDDLDKRIQALCDGSSAEDAATLQRSIEDLHEHFRAHRANEHRFDQLTEHVLGENVEELEALSNSAGDIHALLEQLIVNLNGTDGAASGAMTDSLCDDMAKLGEAFDEYSEQERVFFARYTGVLMPGNTSDG